MSVTPSGALPQPVDRVFQVKKDADVKKLASTIISVVRCGDRAVLRAVGAHAVHNAVRAIATANEKVDYTIGFQPELVEGTPQDWRELNCVMAFTVQRADGEAAP
jgi:stage V sporulation protein SpoVS